MRALILVLGVPGCGKTTLSRELIKKTASTYICSDTISNPLVGHDRVSQMYIDQKDRIYDLIYELAEENLSLGNSVLIDAPHVRPMANPAWRNRIRGIAERTDARLRLIKLACSEEQLHERITQRNSMRDADKLSCWRAFLDDQPISFDVPMDHITIHTGLPLEEQVGLSMSYMSADEDFTYGQ